MFFKDLLSFFLSDNESGFIAETESGHIIYLMTRQNLSDMVINEKESVYQLINEFEWQKLSKLIENSSTHEMSEVFTLNNLQKSICQFVVKQIESNNKKYLLGKMSLNATLNDYVSNNEEFLNIIPLPVMIKSIKGEYLYCNDHYAELMGVEKNTIIGKNTRDFFEGTLYQELIDFDSETIKNAKITKHHLSIESQSKNLVLIKSPMFHKGVIDSLFIIVVDESEEKRLQKHLIESNQNLKQFAYIISHDLKAPLRNIISFIEMIQKKLAHKEDAKLIDLFQFVIKAGFIMNQLIEGLLDFSRVETLEIKPKVTDFNHIIEIVLDNLKNDITVSKAEIKIDQFPKVLSDRLQMIQLFQNLINNALKYSKSNQPPKIEIICHHKDFKQVVIEIKDNGIGIDSKYYDKIFEIFQKLHTDDQYQGTGIGLSICKKIIDRHHGFIKVDSILGEGTSFIFSLPKAEEGI